MSWNWAHTKRKQKEMAEKSASYQEANDTYKYTEFSKPKNATKWQEERERERRMKIITVVMLSLMSMVFITIIAFPKNIFKVKIIKSLV